MSTDPFCNFACLTAFAPFTDMYPTLCFIVYLSVCYVIIIIIIITAIKNAG